MGHGLQMGWSTSVLDDVVKEILEKLYQKGIDKASNRKGVLEMVEECAKQVPSLMAPKVHEVSSWLSSRLARDDKKQKQTTKKEESKQHIKMAFEKWQDEAAVLKKDQATKAADPERRQLFLSKYLGIVLTKDECVQIVTGVEYSADLKLWMAMTKAAKVSKYDDCEYIVDSSVDNNTTVEVSQRKNGISACIKAFNKSKK